MELHLLPPFLHNHPQDSTLRVERLAQQLQSRGRSVVLAYADCGTYGGLDDVCERLHFKRLHGLHYYDVIARPDKVHELFRDDPRAFVLTDFLVRGFRRMVPSEIGLDHHPELLIGDYFANYRQVTWLAQCRTDALEAEAWGAAELFGLPLTVLEVGVERLERELEELPGFTVGADGRLAPSRSGLPVLSFWSLRTLNAPTARAALASGAALRSR